MRRHGIVARRRRIIAEVAVIRAMFATKVHRVAREGRLTRSTFSESISIARNYESRIQEI